EIGDAEESLDDSGGSGHIGLHVLHALGRFEGDATGIEGDSLADEAQVALGALGGILDLDQPRATGRALSDSDDAAVSAGLKLLLPEDGDFELAGLGLGPHDLGIGL